MNTSHNHKKNITTCKICKCNNLVTSIMKITVNFFRNNNTMDAVKNNLYLYKYELYNLSRTNFSCKSLM